MTLSAAWNKYAPEIAAFVTKVDKALKFVTTNRTIVGLADHLPEGPAIMQALGVVEADAALAANFVPAVGGVIALYELYQAFDGRPMDPSDIAAMHYDLEHQ